jgi:hypothetical protein
MFVLLVFVIMFIVKLLLSINLKHNMENTYLIEARVGYIHKISELIKAISKETAINSFTRNPDRFKKYLHLGDLTITNVVNITALEKIK